MVDSTFSADPAEEPPDDGSPLDGPAEGSPDGPPGGPPRRRRRRRVVRVLVVLAVGILVGVVGAAALTSVMLYRYDHNITRIDGVFATSPGEHRPPEVAPKAHNVLLVGTDSRAGTATTGIGGNPDAVSPIGQRADTIMLVHLPADGSSPLLVSIPRDSWVPIPGHGDDKVNAALAFGGPRLLRQTIEQLTGVRIDHYLEVDFFGFKAMTDAVGGVDIDVPADSFDPMHDTRWQAGQQHMDGARALLYVRQRYGLPNGDFDRVIRQHQFLQALFDRARHAGLLTDPLGLNRLLDAATKSVSIDRGLSSRALLSLSRRIVDSGGSSHFMTVPVTGTGWVGDASVVFLDRTRDTALWRAVATDRVGAYLASATTTR